MIIYRALFPNGKSYIGQTINDLKYRKNQHKKDYKNDKHKNIVFYRAIRKYGWDSIEWSIIDTTETQEELNEKEKYWINYYRTFIRFCDSNGYNMSLGGEGNLGHKVSEKTKDKLRLLNLGKKASDETKHKMSLAREKYKGENAPMFGKNHTIEARKKMSETRKEENNALRGIPKTDKHKIKISNSRKGKTVGENHPNVKITEEMAKNIKIRLSKGERPIDIIKDLNINDKIVYNIKSLSAWEYLLPELNSVLTQNKPKKISKEIAEEIKIRLSKGEEMESIVNNLNVSLSTVRNIKYFHTWNYILPELNTKIASF